MQDNVMPTGKWEFNQEVAEVFDNMLERSIPQYDVMRYLVKQIGFQFVKKGTAIVDIGCSNGNAIEPFITQYKDDCDYYCIDVSQPMLEKCVEKYNQCKTVNILNYDIRKGIPQYNASLILSILTLQFVPIEYRVKIVKSIYDALSDNGAFIIVEKVLGNTSEIDDLFVDEYYRIKSHNAYTQEQIQNKRKSLEGVLVPIMANWNENLLQTAGFKKIDCFYRCLNFAGWIAIK
jgi:tRNA (cmo5U34)-methyltransferase